MEYFIYKLDFHTGVHFGTGMLNESTYTIPADQLFSALYIEAIKLKKEKELYQAVKSGRLLISDCLPYTSQYYMIPRPMLYVEPREKGKSEQKKAYKKMKYVPLELLEDYLNGALDLEKDPMKEFGYFEQRTMASVEGEEDTAPFRVGVYHFNEGNGLYVLIAYNEEAEKELMETLLESLSYVGIGGKKSSGLGKYCLKTGVRSPEAYEKRLRQKHGKKMLLSVALPTDDELNVSLEEANYQLMKRSGFVASADYAEEWRRKKDLYVMSAGSCFTQRFSGDIYDVAINGKHPVYRYAKSLFMGV